MAKYLNQVFVETGTYDGSGCLVAVAAGFSKIISMEISPRLFEFSRQRLKECGNVTLLCGDVADLFPKVLEGIDVPCTFWLDAHQPQDGLTAKKGSNSTLLFELETIRQHPIKTHTILIDDIDLLGTGHIDVLTIEALRQHLLMINVDYRFSLEPGNTPGSVLAAHI